jgi:hypothetical protein
MMQLTVQLRGQMAEALEPPQSLWRNSRRRVPARPALWRGAFSSSVQKELVEDI